MIMPEVTGYRVVSTLQSTRLRSTDWTSEAVVSICSSESASAQFRRNEVLIVTHNMDLFSIKCKLWKELLTERISLSSSSSSFQHRTSDSAQSLPGDVGYVARSSTSTQPQCQNSTFALSDTALSLSLSTSFTLLYYPCTW